MYPGRGAKRTIRAPRNARTGVKGQDDFDVKWNILSSSFLQMHSKQVSKLSYEELYRNGHHLVLTKWSEQLYNRVKEQETQWLRDSVKPQIAALIPTSLLAAAVTGSSDVISNNERRDAGERFMKGMKNVWQDHLMVTGMISDVLMYMDRAYCNEKKVPPLQVVEIALFRDAVLLSHLSHDSQEVAVLDVLNRVILDQIEMQRGGELTNKGLVRSCVNVLDGVIDIGAQSDQDKLYVTRFERKFLEASRQYFKQEGDVMLSASDAGTYCRHAWRRLEEERSRCQNMLLESTTLKLENVVVDELFRSKITELFRMDSGVRHMVDNDKFQELQLVYELNAKVDDQKKELTKCLGTRIFELGNDINNEVKSASERPAPFAGGEGDRPKASNVNLLTTAALKWVEDVLALQDRFNNFLRVSFDSDQVIHNAIARSFSDFINCCTRCSEYISLFIDDNMKKGIKGKTESEIDEVLEKAILILRYVQDKDYFERYYKGHLTKRLLYGKSLSNDVEKQMISRLKIELGHTFTSKLEAMFKDMAVSQELTSEYRAHVSNLGDAVSGRPDLAVNVLTSMTWPIDSSENNDNGQSGGALKCIYPPSIQHIKTGFEEWYYNKYQGRKLSWLPNLGTADLKAVFPPLPGKSPEQRRRHELNVPTYCMMILLLFNDLDASTPISFEDIQAKTNIPTAELKRHLQSLAVAPKTRLLLKTPHGKEVNDSDTFTFNEGFKSNFVKIKVGLVTSNKVEGEKQRRDTEKKNEAQRLFNTDAAIVRLMKQRQQLGHSELISETLAMVATKFKPEVALIKKCIDGLIEREYIERVDGATPPAYRYLA